MSAARFAPGIRRWPTRKEGFTASVIATRRWECLRCAKRWRSLVKTACPYCQGPVKELL